MASTDKTPLDLNELRRDLLLRRDPQDQVDLLPYWQTDELIQRCLEAEAQVERLREALQTAEDEKARILSLALGKGITFDDLSVASPGKPPEGER